MFVNDCKFCSRKKGMTPHVEKRNKGSNDKKIETFLDYDFILK